MSAPDEQKEKAAAVGFVGFMTMALGPLGFLVAAVAVGFERMWSGAAPERSRSAERSNGWLGEQRSWLDADHRQRMDRSRRRRAWLDSGADPNTRPVEPTRRRKVQDAIRRATARLGVAASDFAGGFRDGWRSAQDVQRNGGSLRDIAAARPQVCTNCRRDRVAVIADGLCADCADQTNNRPSSPEEPPAPTTGQTGPDPADPNRTSAPPTAEPSSTQPAESFDEPGSTSVVTPEGAEAAAGPTATQQEEPVTQPTQSAQSAQQPATESNATVLRAKLQNTQSTLHRISDLTDQLAAERSTLGHQVRDAAEFAGTTGQSAQAQVALDESNQLATSMGEQLGNFSQGAVSAEESVAQASDGLKVAEQAEDALRSAGADGRAVAPASGASA